ncbi:MAG TPA: hypothetical protein VJT78_13305 [Candidatus Dormibacteraeota bacterium]|nr:hypothetical protein [Candidatus Dormibacteraeota bacterium]
MNDFDRFLEIELRQMLDPVTGTPAPPLRGRRRPAKPLLAVMVAPIELAVEAVTVLEPAVVPVPIQPVSLVP